MVCPQCGTHNPNDAPFCTRCSREVVGDLPEWEYQEVRIPLQEDASGQSDQQNWDHIEPVIRSNLDYLAQEGWEPDQPIDFQSLRDARTFSMRSNRYGHATYERVMIRVKRPTTG
jgi:endogenous inhibitor of DNA gyrase (YacG/DUF329 family)